MEKSLQTRPLLLLIGLLGLLLWGAVLASSAKAVRTPMPMSEALQTLQQQGYIVVRNVEYKKGLYTGSAINAKGATVKFFFNPDTQAIKATLLAKRPDLSLLDVATKVEQMGYHDIRKIEVQKNGLRLEVQALSVTNHPVKLEVNGKTGEVSKVG